MESGLQRKIKNYLNATGETISSLERKAGLKINVARNILRGQSKRPTAETLQAIANVMGCTVQDLLGVRKESFTSEMRPPDDGTPLLEYPELLENSLHSIVQVIKENQYNLTLQQILFILGEVYAYSLKKEPPTLDPHFVEWFVKRTVE